MADKPFSTLAPQADDSPFDLAGRRARALANVNGRLAAGATSRSGASGASGTGQVIATNPARKRWGIQNAGTNVLTVTLGAAAIDLRSATGTDAGNGAAVVDEDWKGAVSVSGTSPRYHWWEE